MLSKVLKSTFFTRWGTALFFVLGFLFDLLTLDRVDDSFTLWQQFLYIIFLLWALNFDWLHKDRSEKFANKAVDLYWKYRLLLQHFVFGSLLSAYAIFYFASAHSWQIFFFMGIIVFLLFANEFSFFQKLGLVFRSVLLSLCTLCFLFYAVPVLLGELNHLCFYVSLLFSFTVFYVLYRRSKDSLTQKDLFTKMYLWPVVFVHVFVLLLYVAKLIPPVPLSVHHAGIYHKVEKKNALYTLSYLRPWWKFWQKKSEPFVASKGDRLYYFASVFSPNGFKQVLKIQWYHKENNKWRKWDEVPIQSVGGRKRGFRGYVYKQNYTAGEWKLELRSSSGHLLERRYFKVSNASTLEPTKFRQISL